MFIRDAITGEILESDTSPLSGHVIGEDDEAGGTLTCVYKSIGKRVEVCGIATDESLDFENDIVKVAGGALEILKYIQKGWGKFNYEHGNEFIGEITAWRFIGPEEALRTYGMTIVGTALEVRGWLYPAETNESCRKVHSLITAGAKLGFSVQSDAGGIRVPVTGRDGRKVTVTVPRCINQISISPQPVCMNTICKIVKSIAAVAQENAPALKSLRIDSRDLNKGIESLPAPAIPGSTGGTALKTELMACDEAAGKRKRRCPQCSQVIETGNACVSCGRMAKSFAAYADGFAEAMRAAWTF